MEVKFLQLHKKASLEYKYIQDKYNFFLPNQCIALSDGTTQSFKSELWAKMLVDKFVINPEFDVNLLKEEFKILAKKFEEIDFEYNSNFAIASLEKAKKHSGGTATFIGLQFINNNTIKIVNCGDTCLFIIRKDKIISIPFKSIDEIDRNQNFIDSTKLLANEIELESFNCDEISVLEDDIIFLCTDAISRLIFREPEKVSLIIECNNFEHFKNFCLSNWESGELEEDDISIAIILPNTPNKIIEILPPKDFSFPKIEEIEFTPTTSGQFPIDNINNQQMEQLNRMIQQLIREIDFVKNKFKLLQALLLSVLFILIFNTLLLFYFLKKNKNIFGENGIKTEVSIKRDKIEPNITKEQNKLSNMKNNANQLDEARIKDDNKTKKDTTLKANQVKKNKVNINTSNQVKVITSKKDSI